MDDLKLYGKNDKELDRLLCTVKKFSDDIGMEFGLYKCAKATFIRGRLTSMGEIKLNEDTSIRKLDLEGTYKYLGIDERDRIQHVKMKEKIREECYSAILRTKLNAKNKLEAINTLAIPVVAYRFNVINWNLEEIRRMDRKIRKLLTLNRMCHPKADVNRMYVPRKEGGRGMINLEMCLKTTKFGLNTYLSSSDDRMLKLVLQHEKKNKLHSVTKESQKFKFQLNMAQEENEKTTEVTKAAKEIKKKAKQGYLNDMKKTWREKPHGRYPLRTDNGDVDRTTTHQWLSSSSLKAETVDFIFAAQDQSLATRVYQAKILKNGADPRCLCTHSKETIYHMISGCPTIVNTEYLQQHDRVAKFIHWTLCKHYEIPHTEKWYEHTLEPVVVGYNVTILWDFTVHMDRKIDANRPNIIIKNHEERTCIMMDVAAPSD